MAQSLPQLTRALASDMMDLEHVESVGDHDGSRGRINFNVSGESPLSGNRLSRLLPDGWGATLVVTSGTFTTVYIEEE